MISSAGPRASAPVPISSCSAKYGSSASAQALGVPAVLGVQLAQLVVAAQRGQLDPAEQRVAHQHPERPRGSPVTGGGAAVGPAPLGGSSVPLAQPLPLVEQAGVDLADQLAQPFDQVGQLLGPGLLGHGLAQRLVGVGQVAQHQALGRGPARRSRRTR